MRRLKGVPRSRIYRLLRKGEVRVNKGRCKPDQRLCVGDVVRIPPVTRGEKKPGGTATARRPGANPRRRRVAGRR
ncbi:S4 domain-containing protein [Ectothiorhodospira haloalkaliphila]|uniref:S4 domain-containing protein n=1 Tax=Ectothiorhodospira haloalkaliphila TaxID=421628 RepID=UPI0030843853